MIKLRAWLALVDTFVGIGMDLMGFIVFGVGQRDLEGRMLLVLSGKGIMCQIHGEERAKVEGKN